MPCRILSLPPRKRLRTTLDKKSCRPARYSVFSDTIVESGSEFDPNGRPCLASDCEFSHSCDYWSREPGCGDILASSLPLFWSE
jgi:hypothetical protein